jgi:hypothetical protein
MLDMHETPKRAHHLKEGSQSNSIPPLPRLPSQARIALLEGERRSADNLKVDLSRRVKMLEFALRQERYGLSLLAFSLSDSAG